MLAAVGMSIKTFKRHFRLLTFRLLLPSLLDDKLVEPQLLRCSLQHALLDTTFRDEAEDVDLLGLADTMSTVHGLQIRLRVPITVVQDDDVGSGQVDAETTGARGEQEDELVAVGLVVLVDGDDTVVVRRASIDAAVFYTRSDVNVTHLAEGEEADVLYPRNKQ